MADDKWWEPLPSLTKDHSVSGDDPSLAAFCVVDDMMYNRPPIRPPLHELFLHGRHWQATNYSQCLTPFRPKITEAWVIDRRTGEKVVIKDPGSDSENPPEKKTENGDQPDETVL